MLTAITLEDFKSYRQATLPLSALTVLIGANASGKSNVIECLRLLSWLAQGQKLSAIRFAVQSGDQVVRGKLEDLAYHRGESFGLGAYTNATEWNQLSMRIGRRTDGLHITEETLTHTGASVPLYTMDQPSNGQGTDARVAYNNFAKGGRKPRVTCTDQAAIFTQLTSPATFDAAHKTSRERIPPITKDLEQLLAAILFLDPVPAQMREYAFPSDKDLQGNGRNVSAVLFNLWGREEQAQNEPHASNRVAILSFIQSLPEQDIAGLSFLEEPRGGVMVQLTETFGGRTDQRDASLLSDGTLRVLAIAAAMLSAPEGSLVVIEEIDNGVHPSRAHHLLQQIQNIASQRNLRVLLSTHNPAMLDALPDSAVPDVVFCYRHPEDGASRLVRLADVPDYPELIAQGTLGHLMTSGALERFVKYHPTGDARKQRALDWLAKMRSGASNE
ncbi:ATP-binding protein [Stenotrophomonas maltophilia]|jgi:predicted ATPase|uniref:AAA family ATPase n=1 Tax=Stenotrophomonas maltophilia TaxID=40324 RepID=A0AAI9G3G8_STEMA|nr:MULTISPECIES: ATP-binding protein [Stenotrophomonas]EKT4077698.1 AAA family ATPase [Stenotrophomonas maltophilia]EKZ1925649.1 AAA family ATPase [Stenotrophomonas maltophilia]EMB2746543.1 AAA family ATPase [Stenotrophomonas maltophilia]MBH1521585.1 AAA family ATPase [Stenotrophomonas maltophilia]MBH1577767.1 AAA family ATPase [Stenotrophomonas maltophilia]